MKNKSVFITVCVLAMVIAINFSCSSADRKKDDISFEALKTAYEGDIKSYDTLKISPEVKSLQVVINLPKGQKFNTEAPFNLVAASANSDIISLQKQTANRAGKNITLPVSLNEGNTVLRILLDFSYCGTGNSAICFFESGLLEIPVEVGSGGGNTFTIEYEVTE